MNTCGLCERELETGYLCPRDTLRLAKRLAELPILYAEVGECLVPRRHSWGDIIATKGAAGPRSPLNEDVLDVISAGRAAEVVRLWRVDVQRVRWPQHGAPAPAPLAADCRWLAMELDWITAHYPAAGDLAREVGELEAQARSVVGDPLPRRKVVGQCIAVTDDGGTVCGADITHSAGESRLVCRTCRTVYEGETDLLLLLHYQPQQTA
ncbi:hypothetical protein ACF09I_34455 [Streptomyces sp. NPDC014940]|uniref:hypothetical protein n=1 Tax=Streptomyces sp. NPDC014940 TaxID=3364932 RepID=UPI0036FDF0FF